MEPRQSDDQYLIVGLNTGPTRTSAGKMAIWIASATFGLSFLAGVSEAWVAFWISLAFSIVFTWGQQYVLDASADVLKKRRLYFLRPTAWEELGKLTDIRSVKRRKPSSDDGESMNSYIDFNFKDGTTHTWSLIYGPSDVFRDQINAFLMSHGIDNSLPNYKQQFQSSTPTNERPPAPSSPPSSSVWDTTPKPAKPEPSSTSASVWDVAPAAQENAKTVNKSVWDQ
ncbi:MAG: hypothetical protein P8R03_08335 [Candidatus Poseidoniaceae archaeon]|nr:hypothetical protein [Candidatus Poseidoniaceae archaeon]